MNRTDLIVDPVVATLAAVLAATVAAALATALAAPADLSAALDEQAREARRAEGRGPAEIRVPDRPGEPRGGAPSEPASGGNRVIALADLREPSAVAVSPDGGIYVCETIGERISVFGRDGKLRGRWGRSGSGAGQLRAPRGIAVAPDGRVYVSDTWNHRIEVFAPDGAFERSWGSYGAAPGEFIEPLGLAADAARVYVADSRNDRVQVFDREGRFLFYVWSRGARDGQLDRPVDVAPAPDGSFSVSDQGNSRIQTFDRDGRFVRSWGGWGPFPGLLAEPGGLERSGDRLYVCDTHNHRVQIFGADGGLAGEWGPALLWPPDDAGRDGSQSTDGDAARDGSLSTRGGAAQEGSRRSGVPDGVQAEDGTETYPSDVALLPDARGAVVCDAQRDRCAVVEDAAGRFSDPEVRSITSFGRAAGMVGTTLFTGAGSGGIVAIDASGRAPAPAGTIGGHGREPIEFVRAASVAAGTETDTIVVSDAGNHRLAAFALARAAGSPLRYDPARARFLHSLALGDEEAIALWPGPWGPAPNAVAPGRAARGDGELFLIDEIHSRVVVVRDDRAVAAWGGHGPDDGSFLIPSDVAYDRARRTVYIADAARGRIQAFDPRGRRLLAWGERGRRREDLQCPAGIATEEDGSVMVVDRWAGRVLRYSRRGSLREAWGTPGRGRGELDKPERIFAGGAGRVLVVDSGGRRVQAFGAHGAFLWDLDVDEAARVLRSRAGASARPDASASAAAGAASSTRIATSDPHASVTAPSKAAAPAADSSPQDGVPSSPCARRSVVRSSEGRFLLCYRLSDTPVPLNAPFGIDVEVYEAKPPVRLASMVALSVEARMPEHGHGLAQPPLIRASGEAVPRELLPDHSNVHGAVGNGRFEVRGMRFHMPGRWEIDFDVGRGALTERAQVEIVLD